MLESIKFFHDGVLFSMWKPILFLLDGLISMYKVWIQESP